jgi:hypothetical protein
MGVGTLAVLGTIARARRLLKQVHVAADSGDAAGAAFPVRALSESVLLLGWASKDEVLAFHVWMLDELRTRIAHHV